MTNAEKTAFARGKSDRISGKRTWNNPYRLSSELGRAWEDGWLQAEYELRSAKRSH